MVDLMEITKKFSCWGVLILLLISFNCLEALVDVKTEINSFRAGENVPIEVLVTVTYDAGDKVDEKSFLLKGKSLDMEYLSQSTQSSITIINGRRSDSNTVVAVYRFFLPSQESGLYILDPVQVDVNGRSYQSESITYEVQGAQKNIENFHLEASVEGNTPLYPGQKVRFIYRIYFRGNIELTVEKLPFLDLDGFQIVGEKKIRSFVENGMTVQEIAQDALAERPGEFSFPEAIIEGYYYQQDFFGRRSYKKPRLKAIAAPVTVFVADFPLQGKPKSFYGAVGNFMMDVTMKTPSKVSVGDKVELAVAIKSKGSLQTVSLPALTHQKLFKNNFRLSDLPPIAEDREGEKVFIVEIRPLSEKVTEIPSIEFSYFDPTLKSYQTLTSKAIPLQVIALAEPLEPLPQKVVAKEPLPTSEPLVIEDKPLEDKGDWREELGSPGVIEIAGNKVLRKEDFYYYFFRSWQSVWLLPLSLLLLFLQKQFQKYHRGFLLRQQKVSAKKLFDKAVEENDLAKIEQSLMLLLIEKGVIDSIKAPEDLPKEKNAVLVKELLIKIQEKRFSGVEWQKEPFFSQAQKVFNMIEKGGE